MHFAPHSTDRLPPPCRVLILGGTTEGRILAERLAHDARFDATISLAGRTGLPAPLALPTRIGGFGGPGGLADYIAQHRVTALIVATHPYAGKMARNAAAAARATATPALLWHRPPWEPVAGDDWRVFADPAALAAAIGQAPRRVLITLGQSGVAAFAGHPQHEYWFRTVDPAAVPVELAEAHALLGRGPFELDAEVALMRDLRIDLLVSKNSGGGATYAKIEAARRLGLPVFLLARPPVAELPKVETLEEVLAWLDQLVAARGE